MKIIRILSLPPTLDIDIHPDSAMLLPGRPFFMPEWGEGWTAAVHPALKIGRLGKNIAPKFASRYYDGVSAALRITLPAGRYSQGLLSGMDSTLVTGEWLDAVCADTPLSLNLNSTSAEAPTGNNPATGSTEGLDTRSENLVIDPLGTTAAAVIAAVSEYLTLKMGDIILLPPVGPSHPIDEGTRIDISADTRPVISFRVV